MTRPTPCAPPAVPTPPPSRPAVRPLASVRRDFWLERAPETRVRHQLRWLLGLIFLVFGLMKAFDTTLPLLVGAPGLRVNTGVEGFSRLLAGLGVPFPLLNAWLVILLETIGGPLLVLAVFLPATRLLTRLVTLPLSIQMCVSLLVGLRQVLGHPVILDGFAIMNQPWRLPLELSLLVGVLFLLWRPAASPLAGALPDRPAQRDGARRRRDGVGAAGEGSEGGASLRSSSSTTCSSCEPSAST